MNALDDHLRFHIVENDERQRSVWPDFRRAELPGGWRFTGFSGSREQCLEQIAAQTTAPAIAAAKVRSGRASPASLRCATAVPFPRPSAALRLFVFPHAGSGASYYHFLARILQHDPIEVHLIQYPGREMRLKETPLTDMVQLIQLLTQELTPSLAEKPFAFFGHSMGALTAFELAHHLREHGGVMPVGLFLSGRQAPQIPGPVLHVEAMSNEAFLDAVGRRYKALPAELLAHREILEIILPSLRADFALMERYVYRERPILDVRLDLLNGTADPWVSRESVEAWQAQSSQPIRQQWLPGGHFYLPESAAKIRETLLQTLPKH